MEWDADIVLQERSLIPQMPQERHKEIVKLARKVIKIVCFMFRVDSFSDQLVSSGFLFIDIMM